MNRWFIALLCCIVAGFSYEAGKNDSKDHEALLVLSGITKHMLENIGNDAEEIYYDTIDDLENDPRYSIDGSYINNIIKQ